MYKIIIVFLISLNIITAEPRPLHNLTVDDFNNVPYFLVNRQVTELIETIRIYKITEELNLSEEQSIRFFPKLKELREAKEEFLRVRYKLSEQLENYLKNPNKFNKEIQAIILEFDANELKLKEKEAKIKKEIANILNSEQLAKYILLQQKFNQEIRELLKAPRKTPHKEPRYRRFF